MGWSQNLQVLANQVIIFGAGQGLFVYNGTPAAGNLIGSIAETTTTDPYGNAVLQGITSYDPASFSAAQLQGGICNFLTATSQAGPYTSQGYVTASANALEVFGGNNQLTQGQIIVAPTPFGTGATGGVVSTTSLAPQTLSALATGSVASSAAETVIGTFTIPAADPQIGTGYRWRIVGSADDTLTPTLALRMRINSAGGTQIGNVFAPITCRSSAADMAWVIEGFLYFEQVGGSAIAVGQVMLDETLASGTPALHGGPTFSGSPAAFSTTPSWSLVVTAQWGTSSASNICRTLAGSLERICY